MNKPKPLIKTEAPPSPNKTNDMRYFLISYSLKIKNKIGKRNEKNI